MAKRPRRDSADSEPSVPLLTYQETPGRRSSSMAPPAAKIITSSLLPSSSSSSSSASVMHCALPPHRETIHFASYDEYETHYLQTHVNRCSECGKNFPTPHFLNVHIEENHDPLILARRDRGEKTFSCFVEGCERKCSTPQKRRRHLIDKHMFPRNYNFFIVNDGIDRQSSLLRLPNPRQTQPQTQQEGRLRNRKTSLSSPTSSQGRAGDTADKADNKARADNMDALVSSMSALKFVPASVSKRLDAAHKS